MLLTRKLLMEKYTDQQVEMMLKNYTLLCESDDAEFIAFRVDLDAALRKLQNTSVNLYKAIVGVFILGNPIQEQAKVDKVSKRQIIRRLNDATHMLVMIMNGEVL